MKVQLACDALIMCFGYINAKVCDCVRWQRKSILVGGLLGIIDKRYDLHCSMSAKAC
ncbi:hypothetical protein XBJ1_0466 [Xenorhabdus bovienii SS-2004]|uniref:Uncharacterized protein n=1 Tax=Xenorhabdus bovienii (strain SS-2004) TaxID=406818 RepID=D3UWA6_XENBS|nr:hypothetical protein XBJ1_0466 [Xenorhabdus bovienii SS-2004]